MAKKSASPWVLFLFALPFAGVGVGFLLFSAIPSLFEWQQMQSWQPVTAHLIHAELKTHRGDDSDTYQAIARYQYEYAGISYQQDRVGIMSGSDNIGRWQQDRATELKRKINQTITVFINPNDPADALIYRDMRWGLLGFKMIFVVVFGGVGLAIIWAGIYGIRKDKQRESLAHQPLWLQEPDWANPIKSTGKAGLIALGFFALIWNAISLPVLFLVPGEVSEGNTAALVGLLFPLIGMGMIVATVVKLMRWRRFGGAVLHLDPWPGAIGGQVAGYVDTALPRSAASSVAVTLVCLRSYYTGSGKNRKKKEKVIWQKDGIAVQELIQKGTRLSFCFDLPENLPASELSDSDYHLWRLNFSAPLAGADLALEYEIPVFVTGERARVNRAASDTHPEVTSRQEQQLEQLMNVEQLPDGVALYFGYFRNPLGKLMGILFGGIFAGAGGLMWNSDAPFFMAAIFSLIGGGIVLGCLYSLLNSYRVKIGARGIYTERRVMGVIVRKRFVEPSRVRHLALKSNGSSQTGSKHTEHFVIDAVLHDKSRVRVAESLNGRGLAEQALESMAMLSGIAAAQ